MVLSSFKQDFYNTYRLYVYYYKITDMSIVLTYPQINLYSVLLHITLFSYLVDNHIFFPYCIFIIFPKADSLFKSFAAIDFSNQTLVKYLPYFSAPFLDKTDIRFSLLSGRANGSLGSKYTAFCYIIESHLVSNLVGLSQD